MYKWNCEAQSCVAQRSVVFIIFSRPQQVLLLPLFELNQILLFDVHIFIVKVLPQNRTDGLSYLWPINSYSLHILW